MTQSLQEPLQILTVGAGIGGLFAAVALRQAGHHVHIFESSGFSQETGAAIHIPPNVNGLLRRMGIKPEEFGANLTEWFIVRNPEGRVLHQIDVRDTEKEYKWPWQMCHRVDLHDALRTAATSPDGPGTPATLHLRSKVVSCHPTEAYITLQDGSTHRGDMIVAADGVHSALRSTISGENIPTFPSGASAFRFLVPISKVKANPITADLISKTGGDMQVWDGSQRRLIIYPCRRNTELNFVCLHPDRESEHSVEGWNNAATLEHVLKVYDEFCQPIKTLLSMAEPSSIKLWRLLDRRALGTWVNGRAALLGDAAHPFLPHQGQGGAQAMEDGAALGALLPLGTRPEAISARLKLYMQARYDRATMVQNFTRQMAFQTSEDDKIGGPLMTPLQFSAKNFGHDAFPHVENLLKASQST